MTSFWSRVALAGALSIAWACPNAFAQPSQETPTASPPATTPSPPTIEQLLARQADLTKQLNDTNQQISQLTKAKASVSQPHPTATPAVAASDVASGAATSKAALKSSLKQDSVAIAHCSNTTGPTQPILKNIHFGADGPSTQSTVCDVDDETYLANTSVSLASTGISYSYNGVSKLSNLNIAAAAGYNFNLSSIEFLNHALPLGTLTPYGMFDQVSQTTETVANGAIKRQDTFTQKYVEAGLVYRTGSVHIAEWLNPELTTIPTLKDLNFQFLVQPFYLDDNLRHSASWNVNMSFYLLHPGLNEYFKPVPAVVPDVGFLTGGFIAETNLDSAVFTAKGTSLSAPTTAPKTPPSFEPFNIPNENYSRLGGRFGFFAQYTLPDDLQKALAAKALTGYAYYANYFVLAGVHHDLDDIVAGLKLPVSSLFSLTANYENGRTENVATRVQTFKIGISFGGDGSS